MRTESRAALKRRFAKLNRVYNQLISEERRIRRRADKLGDKLDRIQDDLRELKRADTLPTAVSHFVHLLEKANRYFEFKTSATRRYNFESRSQDDIYSILIHDQKLMSDFKNIDVSDVKMAANAIFWEPICKLTRQQYDWIHKLVSNAREGEYVMNEDPEVELKKMMKSVPYVYDIYFLSKRLPTKYKKISKGEAYEKYSELVSIINFRSEEALKEKHSSTYTTTGKDGDAFHQNRHVTSDRNGGSR